jgi:hypothetical protein
VEPSFWVEREARREVFLGVVVVKNEKGVGV